MSSNCNILEDTDEKLTLINIEATSSNHVSTIVNKYYRMVQNQCQTA